ncbi:MAG: hypothetical protein ACYC1U_08090 [Candidatus Aquicultorales bacterium]
MPRPLDGVTQRLIDAAREAAELLADFKASDPRVEPVYDKLTVAVTLAEEQEKQMQAKLSHRIQALQAKEEAAGTWASGQSPSRRKRPDRDGRPRRP